MHLGHVDTQLSTVESVAPAEGWYRETIFVVSNEHARATAWFNQSLNANPEPKQRQIPKDAGKAKTIAVHLESRFLRLLRSRSKTKYG